MNVVEIWQEFIRSRDIARAGRLILQLAKDLRRDVFAYISSEIQATRSSKKRRDLKRGLVLKPRAKRIPKRYPLTAELVRAFKWMEKRLSRAAKSISLSIISRWNLFEEIKKVREKIRKFRGKRIIPLSKLINSRDELAPTLVSLLHMESEGEVELRQDRPFGEVFVVVQGEGTKILGEG